MSDAIQKSNRKSLSDNPVPEPERPSGVNAQYPADMPAPRKRKSLWSFYYEAERYEYTNPQRARELFERILEEGLDNYTASPDLWHNAAMVAGRVQHREAQLAFVEAGLREWPDNVDLLCDELQYRYTSHYDLQKAQEIWQRLENMPREVTGPFWRFWVYGAIYHAVELFNPQKGLELLDEGLKWIKRDGLMDILRSYRRVLVDSTPLEQIEDQGQLRKYHKRALKILEERYRIGLELGVENGYVLATELAWLYQEQAGMEIFANSSISNEQTIEQPSSRRDDYLKQALEYLDLAERMYTGNSNHPIWEIYEARARILMAQRRYGDALKVLSSLPPTRQREPSIATMLSLAARMTGEKIEADEQSETSLPKVLAALLQNEGEMLFRIASENPQVALVLKRVVQRL